MKPLLNYHLKQFSQCLSIPPVACPGGYRVVDCGLWIVDWETNAEGRRAKVEGRGLPIVDWGLSIVDCGLWIVDCGLGKKGEGRGARGEGRGLRVEGRGTTTSAHHAQRFQTLPLPSGKVARVGEHPAPAE